MRTAIVAGCALVAFGSGQAFAQATNPIQALEDCVLSQAKRLEISGESAETIAIAAVANCARELTAATPTGGVIRSNVEARAQLKDAMREAAIVQIVEQRAAARTPPPPKVETRKPPPAKRAPAKPSKPAPVATIPAPKIPAP